MTGPAEASPRLLYLHGNRWNSIYQARWRIAEELDFCSKECEYVEVGGTVPERRVVFYKEMDGRIPLLEWLVKLPSKARFKCQERIERLRQEGHELRRPEADILRDKIYELRSSLNGVHYRMLYFFHENIAAVVSHGIIKEDKVPPIEIEKAIERRKKFHLNPHAHKFEE